MGEREREIDGNVVRERGRRFGRDRKTGVCEREDTGVGERRSVRERIQVMEGEREREREIEVGERVRIQERERETGLREKERDRGGRERKNKRDSGWERER